MGKTKTFLVTGATGLIGSHIIERLLDTENARIIALSLTESKLKKMFGKYDGGGKLECIAKDMGIGFDLDSISQGRPVDVVFHAASPISGKTINERP
ncbi:MAG: NAD-dependent epimerase/dehydratase family protein, partial [Treponema sp.]|nr:NAD-dependent epimerase/dehydratase family protein [Treponema sp.]